MTPFMGGVVGKKEKKVDTLRMSVNVFVSPGPRRYLSKTVGTSILRRQLSTPLGPDPVV